RLAIVATGREEFLEKLDAARAALSKASSGEAQGPFKLGPGIFFAPAPLPEAARRIAFLFAGQGAQRLGLARDLFERFPRFQKRLRALDAAVQAASGVRVLEALYPEQPPGFD